MSAASVPSAVLVIVLAGGYGTRLQEKLASDSEYASLEGTNKGLLPLELMGGVLIDQWISDLSPQRTPDASTQPAPLFILATNKLHLPQYEQWCDRTGFPRDQIFCDGTTSNDTRLGAVGTLKAALDFAAAKLGPGHQLPSQVVVIPADTLIKGEHRVVDSMLRKLTSFAPNDNELEPSSTSTSASSAPFGVLLGYPEQDHCLPKRGIVELADDGQTIARFLEKPQPSDTTSRLAAPAVFVFRDSARLARLLSEFLAARSAPPYTLTDRDSPGRFIAWLVNDRRERLVIHRVLGRFDVGSVEDFRLCTRSVWETAFPRLGLMGNPSDSCEGRAITLSIQNFAAVVRLSPTNSKLVVISPHPVHDHLETPDIHHISRLFNGGVRLVKAALFVFVRFCRNQGIHLHDRGFELSYETTIPRQVGLAGSSALICAVFKSLQRWYNVSLPSDHAPLLLLSVELGELGISAGLMDRVIQWHEGLLSLNFDPTFTMPSLTVPDATLNDCGVYQMERLDHLWKNLPSLVLYYSTDEASESGGVHSTVRRRYYDGDPDIRAGMRALAGKAEAGRQALLDGDKDRFARCMLDNFNLRYELYGEEKVGTKNLQAVRQLEAAGYAGKFPGSGGAIVAAPLDHAAARPAPEIEGYTKIIPIPFLPLTGV